MVSLHPSYGCVGFAPASIRGSVKVGEISRVTSILLVARCAPAAKACRGIRSPSAAFDTWAPFVYGILAIGEYESMSAGIQPTLLIDVNCSGPQDKPAVRLVKLQYSFNYGLLQRS